MSLLEIVANPPAVSRTYTVEEFEAYADAAENRDRLLELINGEIVEKVPTQEHGLYVGNIYAPLWNYNQITKKGRVVMEVRYKIPSDSANSPIPGISYTIGNQSIVKRGAVHDVPDLAVEIQSPDDSVREMRDKARYYLALGVKMVWLVYPRLQIVEVYTQTEEMILTISDTLTGGEVLPGFSLSVAAIFEDPVTEDPAANS